MKSTFGPPSFCERVSLQTNLDFDVSNPVAARDDALDIATELGRCVGVHLFRVRVAVPYLSSLRRHFFGGRCISTRPPHQPRVHIKTKGVT